AMIRSAAKNAQDVAVLVASEKYAKVIEEMQQNGGSLSLETRKSLARDAFGRTATYDAVVTAYLAGVFPRRRADSDPHGPGIGANTGGFSILSSGKVHTP